MVPEKTIKALQKIYEALGEFIELVGLEYTEDDEYVCHNRDQVDEEWCDDEMLESIDCAYSDIGYFLPKEYKKGE